ncbi:iron chaperone [Cellulomonas sp. McL0617]|uniref:iron chaperone n=1 Tax=Cellulomonas sp. McL0617 TaxID=3415675 RepID=UPI003CF2EBBE
MTNTTTATTTGGFTDEERDAMKERAQEVRGKKGDGLVELLAKIAEMEDADRVMAERLHILVGEAAPELTPKTWYGMPAYAKDGKVVLFFKPAAKFKARYATLGFSDSAALDDGAMWPTEFALTSLTAADEKRILALVQRATA